MRFLLQNLIYIHALLASFFVPIGVMFAVTGGLYTLDVKGSYDSRGEGISLDAPLEPDLARLVQLADEQLKLRGVAPPTGGARIRKAGESFQFEWTGVNRDVLLEPTDDPTTAKLTIKDTSPYRRLVQLHKAKGSGLAKGISVAWAAGLLLLFASGGTLACCSPPLRRLSLAAAAAGLATFAAYVAIG